MSILITGANGFIGAHCIAQLLTTTSTPIIGTVRTPGKAASTFAALTSAGIPCTNLSFEVVPDPTDVSQLLPVMKGCSAVLHLASSFSYDAAPSEFEEKLLIPALKGTQAVCEAAQRAGVERVVIMSSFAAVYDAQKGLQPGKVYTEEDWSPLDYVAGREAGDVATAYRASKTIAEKAAWEFVTAANDPFRLVTLCPGMVFGKMIHPIESLSQLNASNQIVWNVVNGEHGIPPTKAPVWVDVEDLAITCCAALTAPLSQHERFLVTAGSYDTQEIADIVRAVMPETRDRVPVGEPGKRIRATHFSCASSKVRRVLEVRFKGLENSIVPLVRQLFEMEGRN